MRTRVEDHPYLILPLLQRERVGRVRRYDDGLTRRNLPDLFPDDNLCQARKEESRRPMRKAEFALQPQAGLFTAFTGGNDHEIW